MTEHALVSKEEWLITRRKFLEKEKAFTRMRDELSAERRALPWVQVKKDYLFETADGKMSLADLFGQQNQLIVYHFMFGPDWEEGCPSCSFWADNFDRIVVHLNHRDINLIAVSRASVDQLEGYRKRFGWSFQWASSLHNDFNRDFEVLLTPEEVEQQANKYNFATRPFPVEEAPGISVFYKNESGEIFHTYSCYARGLDMLNGAYHFMDLVPKGRDEDSLPNTMAWLRRRDQYEDL